SRALHYIWQTPINVWISDLTEDVSLRELSYNMLSASIRVQLDHNVRTCCQSLLHPPLRPPSRELWKLQTIWRQIGNSHDLRIGIQSFERLDAHISQGLIFVGVHHE